jgi:flagellar biosynthesis/type III secretory pathway protein FliH
MQFINAESEEELNMLNQTAVPEIIDGVRVIYRLSEDELLREKAFRTEKRIRDERTALDHATAEGRKEGRAEGRKEGIEIGEARGRAEGEAKARTAMIEEMRKHGIDEALINQMVESLKINNGNN